MIFVDSLIGVYLFYGVIFSLKDIDHDRRMM